MGEAGVLGAVDGSAGWRAKRRPGESPFGTATGGGMGILQLMAPDQAKLVPLLGKTTGWDVQSNKREECASLGNDWVSVAGRYAVSMVYQYQTLSLVFIDITHTNFR